MMKHKLGRLVSRMAAVTTDVVQKSSLVGKEAMKQATVLAKEALQTRTFQDAAKGAGVGAFVAVPLPFVGPLAGAVFGAGAGVLLGIKRPSDGHALSHSRRPPAPPAAVQVVDVVATEPADLYTELRKLGVLRDAGLLTQEEFNEQKRKLLNRT